MSNFYVMILSLEVKFKDVYNTLYPGWWGARELISNAVRDFERPEKSFKVLDALIFDGWYSG